MIALTTMPPAEPLAISGWPQAGFSLLAVLAFSFIAFFPGYVCAWTLNLHRFRQRTLAERVCWSIPLSFAVTPILLYLCGRALTLDSYTPLLMAFAAAFLAICGRELLRARKGEKTVAPGLRPHGAQAALLAAAWTALVIASLVELRMGDRLFQSSVVLDYSFRVNWTDSLIRTGVPPLNGLYCFGHAAPIRSYYFWYILCAAVARLTHLPTLTVFIASCVWAGFALASVIGLFLKYFLEVGERLRRQFFLTIALLAITGFDVCVVLCLWLVGKVPIPADMEWWSLNQVTSWADALLWVPHHVVSLVGCMFAFLLAWIAPAKARAQALPYLAGVALSLASAFGASIHVVFAFFLIMLVWFVWETASTRKLHRQLTLAIGGLAAIALLAPYLIELRSGSSAIGGGSIFRFAVREIIAWPDALTTSVQRLLGALAWPASPSAQAYMADQLCALLFLIPGYIVELGVYALVLLICFLPKWRSRQTLTHAQRTLLVISLATFVAVSFIRSAVIATNDFGWRGAMFFQFSLLLLAAELFFSAEQKTLLPRINACSQGLLRTAPRAVKLALSLLLGIGLAGAAYQLFWLRVGPILEQTTVNKWMNFGEAIVPAHEALVSTQNYWRLDRIIPQNAVVQFNPTNQGLQLVDYLNVKRQAVVSAVNAPDSTCGAALGGDPTGCAQMKALIVPLFQGASAGDARNVCRQFGIDYLIARPSDPAWKDKQSWVWNLSAVIDAPEFRALHCR